MQHGLANTIQLQTNEIQCLGIPDSFSRDEKIRPYCHYLIEILSPKEKILMIWFQFKNISDSNLKTF
jgi:hypothetical protein